MNTHTHRYKPTSSWPKVITPWQPMPFTCTLPAPASVNIFPCYSLTLPLNALNQVLKGLKTACRHFIHCRDGRFKYKWMHSLSKPQQTPNTLLWWVLEKNALWTATFTYSVEAVTLLEKWHCNSMIPHKSLNHLALSRTRPHAHNHTSAFVCFLCKLVWNVDKAEVLVHLSFYKRYQGWDASHLDCRSDVVSTCGPKQTWVSIVCEMSTSKSLFDL